MSFRRRNYPEVLDNLLTTLVGGVAAETHPFPPSESGPFSHPLEQPPVRQVVSVYGMRNGEPFLFKAGSDYQLGADQQTLSWISDTQVPDAGTLIHVNYIREGVAPALTDLQVGSVMRTMTESVALEMARLYAQLEAVYKAGFIDTATGSSLDKVVALLDVDRFRGSRPSAKIRFTRAAGASGAITIPVGTRILDEQVKFEYEITEAVTMSENQNSVTISARDLEPGNEPVPADTLTLLSTPIVGVDSVTNPGPASRAAADETDEELRARAKNFLHGSEKATSGALRQVLVRNQVDGDIDDSTPGEILVTPHGDDLNPSRLLQLEKELNDTRPAGIKLTLQTPLEPLVVDLRLRVTTTAKTPETELRTAHSQLRDTITAYFDELETRADASINQIVGRALSINYVEDIQFEQASTTETIGGSPVVTDRLDIPGGVIDLAGQPTVLGELALADNNLPTEVDLVVNFPDAADVPEQAAIEAALGTALAYLNTLNETAADPADAAALQARQLSHGKLLHIVPLPGHTAATLADYDAAPDPTTLPQAADRAPYTVTAYLTQASGVSQALAEGAPDYTLTTLERLLLNSVVIAVESS